MKININLKISDRITIFCISNNLQRGEILLINCSCSSYCGTIFFRISIIWFDKFLSNLCSSSFFSHWLISSLLLCLCIFLDFFSCFYSYFPLEFILHHHRERKVLNTCLNWKTFLFGKSKNKFKKIRLVVLVACVNIFQQKWPVWQKSRTNLKWN